MGGAVSSGRDNDELIDNLMGSNYIRTRAVEQVFRALDRADYMTRDARDQAYKDLAWRSGLLHMSAPCIYSEVMENLELKPGLTFLNVGSGTGYLSTLVGLILGAQGISHGVEIRPSVVEYANKRLSEFMENSAAVDEFNFCEPKFYVGNALCLAPLLSPYDRVYCGAGCPAEYENYFKQLIKVGGILVMPLEDNLVQVRRVSDHEWTSRTVLNVSFATLSVPTKQDAANLIKLDEQTPVRLQQLARARVRSAMRAALGRRHPELRRAPPRAPPAKKSCPRRICIPIDDESDVEGLGVLHDLYRDTGASEMNALLSFMLSMGHNRVAGALRFDRSDTDDDSDRAGDDDGGGSPDVGLEGLPRAAEPSDHDSNDDADERPHRCGLITLDFRDILGDGAGDTVRAEVENARNEAENARNEAESARDIPECARAGLEIDKNEVGNLRSQTEDVEHELKNAPVVDKERHEPEKPQDAMETTGNMVEGTQSEVKIGKNALQAAERTNAESEAGGAVAPGSGSSEVRRSDSRKSRKSPGEKSEERRRRSSEEKAFWSSVAGECSRRGSAAGARGQVPAEVEIYLGKTSTAEAGPSNWGMEWEDGAALQGSSDEEPRHKDSGLGEETSPDNTTPTKSESEEENRDSLSDDVDDVSDTGAGPQLSSQSSDSDPDERQRRRNKRRAASGGDARRVRLSLLMKQGVKELPLPPAMKKYVNLQRCYQF
ncbi:uncharacterized protein LOC128683808 [Plodia interpunctella]|uniref:uncharacterized protein LOC128683808 n=1 Tax=Plodia interpunctella TaxID=58824 RepID=UPI00236877E8|nr:uncharacterized protein LOC128683808 [Plodia interpunctella]